MPGVWEGGLLLPAGLTGRGCRAGVKAFGVPETESQEDSGGIPLHARTHRHVLWQTVCLVY